MQHGQFRRTVGALASVLVFTVGAATAVEQYAGIGL